MQKQRKTKIIVSIGNSDNLEEKVTGLMSAGADGLRLDDRFITMDSEN